MSTYSYYILFSLVLLSKLLNLHAFNVAAEGRMPEEYTRRETGKELDITKKPGYEPFRGESPERGTSFEGTGSEPTKPVIIFPESGKAGTSSVTLPIVSKAISTDLSLKTPVASLSATILDASRAYNDLEALASRAQLTDEQKAQAQKLVQKIRTGLNTTEEAARTDKLLQAMRTNLQSNLDALLSNKKYQITPNALDVLTSYNKLSSYVSRDRLSPEDKEALKSTLDTAQTNLNTFEEAASSSQDKEVARNLRQNFKQTEQRALERMNTNEPTARDLLTARLEAATQAVRAYTQQGQKALATGLQRIIQLASTIQAKTAQIITQAREGTPEAAANLLNSATESLDLLKDYFESAREEWPHEAKNLYHSAIDSLYEVATSLKEKLTQNTLVTKLYNQISNLRQKTNTGA